MMAELADREKIEARLARALAKELTRFKLVLLGVLPELEAWMMDIAPELWQTHTANLTKILNTSLVGTLLGHAETIIDDNSGIFGVDWGQVNQDAADWAKQYTYDLVKEIKETSEGVVKYTIEYIQDITRELQITIPAFFEDPTSLKEITARLTSSFGPVRAEMIAITETTRAANEAEILIAKELRSQGIKMAPIWLTTNDERVCPICGDYADARGEYNEAGRPIFISLSGRISNGFEPPAHPRCRCGVRNEPIYEWDKESED